ncbi:MAG: S1 RNA-binding domain-containing protein [Nanoarchaeota archaeon]
MLHQRPGFPEEDEIVLCRVTEIIPNSVFVELVEYRRQGMIHISEIAPGRIRNLREYVVVGKEIICKILRLDRERGHIDLSLRRVNSTERQAKLDETKQELKAEQLIANLAKKLKLPVGELYKKLAGSLLKNYSSLHLCFQELVEGQADLEKLGLEKAVAEELTAAVIEKFRPEKIVVKGEIRLQTYAPTGIEKIKATLGEIQNISPALALSYLGAGRYRLALEDADYKPAEKKLAKVEGILEKFNDKISKASFIREKD